MLVRNRQPCHFPAIPSHNVGSALRPHQATLLPNVWNHKYVEKQICHHLADTQLCRDCFMFALQVQLWQLSKLMSPKLCQHLEMFGVVPMLYGASWLMTGFSADFPITFSARYAPRGGGGETRDRGALGQRRGK